MRGGVAIAENILLRHALPPTAATTAACGGITQAVKQAKSLHPHKPIIVEVENFEEFCEAVKCPVDRIMLDNFSADEFQQVQQQNTTIPIEVSGNITADAIAELASSNIAAISTGALTKHVQAVDLSMRIV